MHNKTRHYFKVTFRELVKYKTQSVISIIGLAIGFTAFVLGGYWLWWETHFDNFHPDGDRIYCLTTTGLVKKRQVPMPIWTSYMSTTWQR